MTDTTRKLATIVALDVAGYSARTEADESKTIAQITLLRPVIEGIAKAHGGRVFNTAGDGFMLEFASSFSAVEAALELADECRPRVRVGVHVGEVSVQLNGDLLGHGVNVAARLMAKAEPGSTLISADVCRMIRGPMAERFASRGTVQLDKMAETIEIFAPAAAVAHATPPRLKAPDSKSTPLNAILALATTRPAILAAAGLVVAAIAGWWIIGGASTPSPDTTAPSTSIAVLPFENLSTDKNNAFFAVGVQDEILTRLSKIGSLRVISRTSTAHLASRPENVAEIAKQLGVANILEGSVQRDGNSVRVNVQLIEASTDSHLWAEVYDRKLDNIFTVQSEIAIAIADALSAKVTGSEKKSLTRVPTTNTAAYDSYLRGLAFQHQGNGKEALASFKEAVRLDPEFALAWIELAIDAAGNFFGTSDPRRLAEVNTALDTVRRLQPDLPELQLAEGVFAYYIKQDYEGARKQFEKVRALLPNDVQGIFFLGLIARRQGRWDDSRSLLEQAIVRDPMRADLRISLGVLLVATRDFASAMRVVDDAMNRWPDSVQVIGAKIYLLLRLGRLEEAETLLKPLKSRLEVSGQVYGLAMLQRKYAEAIPTAQALLDQNPDEEVKVWLRLGLGTLYTFSGDAKSAKEHLDWAKNFLLSEIAREPRNRSAMVGLAYTYCHLGEREQSLKYIERAIGLLPASKDRFTGPGLEEERAKILARFGDRERAIPEIARLLKTDYDGPLTPVELRLDPMYDKLRGDPRFEALLK